MNFYKSVRVICIIREHILYTYDSDNAVKCIKRNIIYFTPYRGDYGKLTMREA